MTTTTNRSERRVRRRLERYGNARMASVQDDPRYTRTGEIGGQPYIDKYARLFKAGTHRGKPYTEADLDTMVSKFRRPATEVDWTTPIYKDHKAKLDNLIGNVRSVERRGRELFGWLRFIGSKAVDKVRSGLWRKLSSGIYYAGKELDEVSVLPDPHFDDTQLFHQSHEEDESAMPTTKKEEDKDQDGGGKSKETPVTPPAPVPPADDKENFSAQLRQVNDNWEARFSQSEAERKADRARLEAQDKELETYRKERMRATASGRVELFRSQGKTTKFMSALETDFVESLDDAQFEKYAKLKEAQPCFADFQTYGSQENSRPGDDEPGKGSQRLMDKYGPKAGKGKKNSKKDEE